MKTLIICTMALQTLPHTSTKTYSLANVPGIDLTGVADSYAAFSSTLSRATHKLIVLPAGTINIVIPEGGQIVPALSTTLFCQPGAVIRIFERENSTKTVIRADADRLTVRGCRFESYLTQSRSPVLFALNGGSHLVFDSLYIDGRFSNTGIDFHTFNMTGSFEDLLITRGVYTHLGYALFKANANTSEQRGITVKSNTFDTNNADDLEFNSPGHNFGISGIIIERNTFRNGQHFGTNAGFGVGLANVREVTLSNNTFVNYYREAIHIEFSDKITIRRETFVNSGNQGFATIQVIAGSTNVRISKCTFDLSRFESVMPAINVSTGGAYPTAQKVEIVGNVFKLGLKGQAVTGTARHMSMMHNVIIGARVKSPEKITGQNAPAVELNNVFHFRFIGNTLQGVAVGLSGLGLRDASDTTISHNVFKNVGIPIEYR